VSPAGLDTNVLVRYLVRDDPGQSRIAASVIEDAADSGERLIIQPVVLCELVWVLETAYEVPRDEVAGALEAILRTAQFEVVEKDLVWRALADYRKGPGDFADYLIGQGAQAAGAAHTLTFDQKLKGHSAFRLLH
jgi:predicted nucleic-acid-binding protein